MIVVGILLALAADAAWDSRKDRQREQAYLAALLTEMRAAREELEGDQANRRRRIAAIDSLQAYFGRSDADNVAVTEWAISAEGIVFFFPPSSTLNDLISSGGLQFIRSGDLRRALMEYQQEVPRLRQMEDREESLIELELRPYLGTTFALYPGPASPEMVSRLLADQRFWNLMWERRRRVDISIRFGSDIDEVISRVIAMVEEQLGLDPATD